jgi:hypothetical protein
MIYESLFRVVSRSLNSPDKRLFSPTETLKELVLEEIFGQQLTLDY